MLDKDAGEFAAYIKLESDRWGKIFTALGARVQ